MWDYVQMGKIMRRQVRDRNQKLVVKAFKIEEYISEGEDWKVMNVEDQDTMSRVTLKLISKSQTMPKERKDQIFNQIQNQRKMSGRSNFIDLLQVYEDSSTVYMLMQKWGIPLEKILQRRQTLMQKEVQLIFCQLIDILQNLRSQNITHGSINLFSVLLSPGRQNQLQLTNFAYSEDLTNSEVVTNKPFFKFSTSESNLKLKDSTDINDSDLQSDDIEYPRIKCGSIELNEYTSPEEYHHERETNKRNLCERDVWSCGVLLFKLLTGTFPFNNQQGKLAPNKIKNATFSFPKLNKMTIHSNLLKNIDFNCAFNADFVSLEWKQLLKRMISVQAQRISMKELIEHPFKSSYFQLKSSIPDLRTSQPSLSNLFSSKIETKSKLYEKSWKINFENQSESDEEQNLLRIQDREQSNIRVISKEKENNTIKIEDDIRDSVRESRIFEDFKQFFATKQSKLFRIHKTQYGPPPLQSQQNIENTRHQTVGNCLKEKKKKERVQSFITPMTIHTAETTSQKQCLIAKQPAFIAKFKYFKKQNWLGYILNNTVGVVLKDGEHIIGHNKMEFKYIEDLTQIDSQILIDSSDNNASNGQKMKQAIYPRARLTPNQSFLNMEDNVKCTKKLTPNFKSEQVSSKELEAQLIPNVHYTQFKATNSDLLTSVLMQKSCSIDKEKFIIYLRALDYFGERVVKGKFDLWVDKFWKDGNVYIFLLNSGCWQVVFLEVKGFKIYAVDQNDIGWSRDISQSPDVLYKVREIIKKYAPLVKKK